MSSSAATNRANAQQSTGPKTEAGKSRSAMNALRHGLYSKNLVMGDDDLRYYEELFTSFLEEYDPQTSTETSLVRSLADTTWRLNRLVELEVAVLGVDDLEKQSRAFSNFSLYSQRLSRQFEKTVAQLRELQAVRESAEKKEESKNGFVFSSDPEPELSRGAAHGSNSPFEPADDSRSSGARKHDCPISA